MSGIFPPQSGPRVFALPPGVDFTRALVTGLDHYLAGHRPDMRARTTIWVNTRRTARSLQAHYDAGPAGLIPRIRVITDLIHDPNLPRDAEATTSALRRKLDLARMIGALLAAQPGLAPKAAIFDLAQSLLELLDEMQAEGVTPDQLSRLDIADHAQHWQQNLRFFEILRAYTDGVEPADGQGRLRRVAEFWAERWRTNPAPGPVLVAGSTGSRGPTRIFMKAVAHLPQGAVILPGFDTAQPTEVWQRLGEGDATSVDHPQYGFRRLADWLGIDPAAIMPWSRDPTAQPQSPQRNTFLSLALRPAPVTDQWRRDGATLAGTIDAAFAGITWVNAPDPRAEVRAITTLLVDAARSGTRAALITPDRILARKVTTELDRWRIIPDDSAGRPLSLTPPGIMLALTAGLDGTALTPVALLSLLKHPLVNTPEATRQSHTALTAKLELEHLRRSVEPVVLWEQLRDWAAREDETAVQWIDWLERSFTTQSGAAIPLAARVAEHRALLEALGAGPSGDAHILWDKAAGEAALALMDELADHAEAYGPIDRADYAQLINSQLLGGDVPEDAAITNPNITIWGTLEARVQSADLVILGGLNEGVWPKIPDADPWLGRGLRRMAGLPDPDLHIGLAAHDFQQAMGASKVVLTRALRDDENPSVASRWLLRLENLANGLSTESREALEQAQARGDALLDRAGILDRPEKPVPPAPRPATAPPLMARPRQLSVTQIERLIRDPYDIYADKILKLRMLDPLNRQPDARERGTAYHAALERFVNQTETGLDDDAEQKLRHMAKSVFETHAPQPAQRRLWLAKFERSTHWLIVEEHNKRARATPLAREISGGRKLDDTALDFTITAKADRIDRSIDGKYAIYDYKAGDLPPKIELNTRSIQLPLEALIAEAGGFADLPAGPVFHLEVIGVGACKNHCFDTDTETLRTYWQGIHDLIRHYQDPETAYIARLRPDWIHYGSDYEHLSRYGEWADSDPPAGAQDG